MISLSRIAFLTLIIILSINLLKVKATDLNGSNENGKDYRFNLSIVPQYLAVNALRIDIAYAFKETQSLIISPRLYTAQNINPVGNDDFNNNTYDLSGFGLELSHIFFLDDANEIGLFYHGYNVHYTIYQLNYQVEGFTEGIENGLPVFVSAITDETIDIRQWGLGYLIGFQHYLSKEVFFDFFIGLGVKYSDLTDSNNFNRAESELRASEFKNNFISYGYQGTHLNTGVKFGVKF